MKKMYLYPARNICFILVLIASIGQAQPPAPTQYQIIHNSADPYLDTVHAFENLTKYLLKENFTFRTALPERSIPSGPVLIEHIGLELPFNPNANVRTIYTSNGYQRIAGENYVLFYTGVFQEGFAKNPDSISTAFNILFYERPVETVASDSVSFVFVNGVTDLARVDIQVPGRGTVVDNAIFAPKPIVAYPLPLKSFRLFAGSTTFILTDSSGTSQIKAFVGDLSPYKGQSIALFTSGFLNPSANKNGAPLGLFGALKDGTVIEFTSVLTSMQPSLQNEISFQTNINKDEVTLLHSKGFSDNVSVQVFNLAGKQFPLKIKNADTNNLSISFNGMQQGTYLIKVIDRAFAAQLKYFHTK